MIGKNNPFNIRYSKSNNWLGQTGQTRGFCDFDSLSSCYRAFWKLMFGYYKLGKRNIRDVVSRFAPPTENATEAYINYCCFFVGVDRTSYLFMSQWLQLGESIHRFESGSALLSENYSDFMEAYSNNFYNCVSDLLE